uniref:Uncharacterized protein n=1 Tax=Arundo donax TaxID=35708 RepID=A0A0A8YS45_ARUDO
MVGWFILDHLTINRPSNHKRTNIF